LHGPERVEEDRIDDRETDVRFALVHGAWHVAWAWDALTPELEARGHRVVAPELPREDVDAGAAEYARVVIDALDRADDAIVVGHPLGGMTVPLVPARMHVCLCAYVPQPGRALIDRGPEAFRPRFADSAIRDELERSYWPDPAAAAHDLAISHRERDLGWPASSTGTETELAEILDRKPRMLGGWFQLPGEPRLPRPRRRATS
jgi:hypothetical protein